MSVDPEDVVNKLKKLEVDDAISELQIRKVSQVRFANSDIVLTNTVNSSVLKIFLAKRKRLVTAEIEDSSDLDSTLKHLVKVSASMAPNESYCGIASGKFTYPKEEKILSDVEDKLVDYAHECITSAEAEGAKRSAGVVYHFDIERWLASSSGVNIRERRGGIECSIRSFVEKDASGHAVSCSATPQGFSPKNAGKESAEMAVRAASYPREHIPEGKYDVIFGRLAIANLLYYAGMAFSAFAVDAGMSMFKDRLGQHVAAPIVNLDDNGIHPASIGSHRFDEEGHPTRVTRLIERGVLRSYLHNTSTASRYKVKSTGNAGVISPAPWTLLLYPGNASDEELIQDTKNGLFITNVWYTRYQNRMTGDFSTIPRDAILKIKNGKVIGSVKDIRVSDNLITILMNIASISKDVRQIHWWEVERPVFTPAVKVKDVTITKSTR